MYLFQYWILFESKHLLCPLSSKRLALSTCPTNICSVNEWVTSWPLSDFWTTPLGLLGLTSQDSFSSTSVRHPHHVNTFSPFSFGQLWNAPTPSRNLHSSSDTMSFSHNTPRTRMEIIMCAPGIQKKKEKENENLHCVTWPTSTFSRDRMSYRYFKRKTEETNHITWSLATRRKTFLKYFKKPLVWKCTSLLNGILRTCQFTALHVHLSLTLNILRSLPILTN